MKKKTNSFTGAATARRNDIGGRVPPQNPEAEQSVLGSVLISDRVFDNVETIVGPADFYESRHRKIFEVMQELSRKDEAIDVITVAEGLRIKGWLESAGGASYLSALSDSIGTPAHAEEYANIVKEKSILRNLIDISTEAIEDSLSEGKDPKIILESVENKIFNLAETGHKGSMQAVKDLVADVFQRITAMGSRDEKLTGLPTGFARIDDYTSGLQPSELVIIAARPSLGKTSLALNIAYNLSVNKAKNIVIFSFEMNEQDLVKRLLAYGSRITLNKIRTGKYISQAEKSRLIDILGRLSGSSIRIDTEDNTVFDMRSKIRSLMTMLKRDGEKLDMVIIDYLQLVKPDDRIPREQQIAQISRALKAIAREMEIPVVALSQLNREVDREKGTRKTGPKLSNLRESGALEQDADVVMFIDRDEEKDMRGTMSAEGEDDVSVNLRKCKLIIAKNRNGPIGEQPVYFIPDYTAFQEITGQTTDESQGADYGDRF